MEKQKRKRGCLRMSHTQTDRHIRTHSRIGGARERSKERLANGEGNESDGRESECDTKRKRLLAFV